MPLVETQLFGVIDKVAQAIERLRQYEPPEGYYLAFSGGKDSCVIKALADMAGVQYDAHYSVTTIDPPELVYFIREHHPDVIWDRPKEAFLKRLIFKGFPLRQNRWCCQEYKERGGEGRVVVLGIRSEESFTRSDREIHDEWHGKERLHPILDWNEADVWDFIEANHIPYCKLYDEGFSRVGCVFCPFASSGKRIMELRRYPGFERSFRAAFRRLYANRKARGMTSVDRWPDGDAMFDWWIGLK